MKNSKHTLNYPTIIVTTCEKYQYLVQIFDQLIKKFWPEASGYLLHLDSSNEKWSNQILKILSDPQTPEVFILMAEEFFLYHWVDNDKIRKLLAIMLNDKSIGRIGLQSVNDGYNANSVFVPELDMYELTMGAPYRCSFEASIFRKSWLKKIVRKGLDPWECERDASRRACLEEGRVLVPKEKVLIYSDATRRGEKRFRYDPVEKVIELNIINEDWEKVRL